MNLVDEVIGESKEPVVPSSAIFTGSGVLAIAGISYVGTLPKDGLPNTILITQTGSGSSTSVRYVHPDDALEKMRDIIRDKDAQNAILNLRLHEQHNEIRAIEEVLNRDRYALESLLYGKKKHARSFARKIIDFVLFRAP